MKYVVKCEYCDNTYIVDVSGPNSNFECNGCGATNNMNNVVDRLPTWKGIVKDKQKDRVIDTDISAIKSFNINDYKVQTGLQIVTEEYAKACEECERDNIVDMFRAIKEGKEGDWYPEMQPERRDNF